MTKSQSDSEQNQGSYRFRVSAKAVSLIFSALLLIWVLQMLLEAYDWPTSEDWLFPFLVGIPTALLLLFRIGRTVTPEILSKNGTPLDQEDDFSESPREGEGTPNPFTETEVQLSLIVIGLTALIYYTGFVISIPVFLFGMIYYLTRDLRKTVVTSIIVLIFIYVLFVRILNMVIWEGTLGIPAPI